MIHSRIRRRNPFPILLTIDILFPLFTVAQIGSITQDVYTHTAFPLQKPCARSCFVGTGGCPEDNIGLEIGCKTVAACGFEGANWPATNDCYCRSDLQRHAQVYLTTCIQHKCAIGDVNFDASRAGSIYAQYCLDKGYTPAPTAPATAVATTTGTPSGSGSGLGSGSSSSSSNQGLALSTHAIIGIAIGGFIALVFILAAIKGLPKWWNSFRGGDKNLQQQQQQQPPPQQQPHYPRDLFSDSYHADGSRAEHELTPGDSFSMVGVPRPPVAPTVVSNVPAQTGNRLHRDMSPPPASAPPPYTPW